MKTGLNILLSLLGWFAIIAQFVLMLQARASSVPEMIIRFFSFFTILTNTLVAIYFTLSLFPDSKAPAIISRRGVLTALAIYIAIVGLVYQVALRHIWEPQGLQLIVDELLHTIIPILVVVYWYFYGAKTSLSYSQITSWMVYPLFYLVYILIRGDFSGFYPYPFIDVSKLGIEKALINALVLLLVFFFISGLFVFIGKAVVKRYIRQ